MAKKYSITCYSDAATAILEAAGETHHKTPAVTELLTDITSFCLNSQHHNFGRTKEGRYYFTNRRDAMDGMTRAVYYHGKSRYGYSALIDIAVL